MHYFRGKELRILKTDAQHAVLTADEGYE